MKFKSLIQLMLYLASILGASGAFAFELTPKKAGVFLRAQPTSEAAKIKILEESERLTVVSKSGLYWSVSINGQKGFVLASEVKPARSTEDDSTARSGLKTVIQGNKENHKRTRSAVMGIRGLDDAEEVTNKSNERANPNATQKMENRQISKDSVNRIEDAVNKENEQSNGKK